MPELPEVETTVRGIRPHIVGQTIVSAWADPVRPIKTTNHSSWKVVRGQILRRKVTRVERRAKNIVVGLDNGHQVYIHQKMTGHLMIGRWVFRAGRWVSSQAGPLAEAKNQHIRMFWKFGDGTELALSDTRRFATITYVQDPREHPHLHKLGPEPLEISWPNFQKLFQGKKGKLKPTLLDPYFIAGIGNIYADEVLWAADLHPLSRVENLKPEDLKKLYRAVPRILKQAIRAGGSSSDDYRMPSGQAGKFQDRHRAYQMTGQACAKKDGGKINRIVVGQRATHFCPKHQVCR